ncbi:3016_t:CDS:2 [Paraglomus occultum]|uniref:3016_t:CDS:1 n=1 Tax=Paraglomus occultum TaxID=144539 RepID=A0A9N8VRS7_9GLOM|nr:3016_t:CDS:2 [Paraglomus occultum]
MSSIYAELARLKFNTEQKSALLYYLTKTGEAEAQAEKTFTVCNNDEEKYAYLNLVLGGLSEKSRSTEIESVNLVTDDKISEPHLETEFVEKLKVDTFEEPVFGKYNPKDADLEKFAQKLNLDQLRKYGPPLTDEDIEKFYGSHVLIIDGKLVRYGSELSGEEYHKLVTEHPGALYGPVVQEVVCAKFSSIEDGTKKEWQARLPKRRGWSSLSTDATGYGGGNLMKKVSEPWGSLLWAMV